jgi:hypothetical protein
MPDIGTSILLPFHCILELELYRSDPKYAPTTKHCLFLVSEDGK